MVLAPAPWGEVGVYRTYRHFANALRDTNFPWIGSGRFVWAPHTEGYKYPSRAEAESAYRNHFDLGPEAPVPFHG